jgi:TetR/AcrR family transcriptional regulator, transcriptional repressor for nem operon
MRAFWRHGYHATPVSELTAATGMYPGALYQTFGDKQGLLLAALARYRELGGARVRALLSGAESPLDGIREYLLDQLAMSHHADGGQRGCLAANSALELLPGDQAVAEAISGIFCDLHACIAETVTAAQEQGQVDGQLSASDVATQLLALVEGMFVLGRVCADPGRMRAAIDLTVGALRSVHAPGGV